MQPSIVGLYMKKEKKKKKGYILINEEQNEISDYEEWTRNETEYHHSLH